MTRFELFLFLAFIVPVIGAVAYSIWWHRYGGGKLLLRKQEMEAERRVTRVRMNGWRYDGTHDGNIRYRIDGATQGGLDWKIEYDSDHSSSGSTPKLIFLVETLNAPAYEWQIFDRWGYDLFRQGAAKMLLGGVAKMLAAMSKSVALKTDFFYGAVELPAGSAAFCERFALIATDSRYADLIDADSERRILDWPAFKPSMSKKDNCFSAGLEPEGLRVQLYVDGPSFEVIEHLARLGQMLADRSVAVREEADAAISSAR